MDYMITMVDELYSKIPLLKNPEEFLGLSFRELYRSPPIVVIEGLLEPWECEHIISLAAPNLKSSTMVINNKEVVDTSGRSSRSAYLTRSGEEINSDPVIDRLLNRVSQLSGESRTQIEGMKVVNYRKGEKYLGHYDYFRTHQNFLKKTGDRRMTFFIYLNDLAEQDGGETHFSKIGLKVKPKTGTGVFWTNMDFQGNYFENTTHGGEEVLGETQKWGINLWIREKPY